MKPSASPEATRFISERLLQQRPGGGRQTRRPPRNSSLARSAALRQHPRHQQRTIHDPPFPAPDRHRGCRPLSRRLRHHRHHLHHAEFVLVRSAGHPAVQPWQRQGQDEHRCPAYLCCRGRSGSSRNAGFCWHTANAHASRQFPHLFQTGQPPTFQQPRCRISHDLLDGIQARLRHALGLRETCPKHSRLCSHAAESREKSVRPYPGRNAAPHCRIPTVGWHDRGATTGARRQSPPRSANVLHAQPAGVRRRPPGSHVEFPVAYTKADSAFAPWSCCKTRSTRCEPLHRCIH